MNYFRLIDDIEVSGRWWLKSPYDARGNPLNADLFTMAKTVSAAVPLRIPVRKEGKELDFTFGAFDMPVLNSRSIKLLKECLHSRYQTFRANVENYPNDYVVVNFLECRECIDESRSVFVKWGVGDGRPDKIGQYRQVSTLRINPTRVDILDAFRLDGWNVALIVSETIRLAFERQKITGVRFLPVN